MKICYVKGSWATRVRTTLKRYAENKSMPIKRVTHFRDGAGQIQGFLFNCIMKKQIKTESSGINIEAY